MTEPVRFTPDVEHPAEREETITREILEQMGEAQRRAAGRHRHAHRDAHAKSHAILKATLEVHEGLAPELTQGIFARPGRYEAVARLSSAPGDIHTDRTPAPRGWALKVLGVEGERLLSEPAGHNQDFLMVNFPTLAFGTVGRYQEMLGLLEKNSQNPELLQRLATGAARVVRGAVEAVGGTPSATLQGLGRDNAHVLGETYFTQGALRYGDHIAKVSLAPESANVRALTGQDMDVEDFSSIRDVVADFFSREGAEYTLRAQLATDLEQMPVEDASVLWDEEQAPHQPVATLRIAPQDTYSPRRRVYGDDVLTFNPWNGVVEHQPLGSIMRVRKRAYEQSTRYRHEFNDRPAPEPTSLDEIPD
ncbi:catalase family protein [Micrococcus sp. EYE_162]|uniref:catalase family protein n=1 Tax=unclassified Micrococcus TaxID=2620948 RepID=UPI002002E441|nr:MULTISPECIES: catalase family protein [unclassified Micrococcus]MCK6095918.1 catalase family protein [Micrococcus sp. EYE_212]MCK6172009.1 catalase family protein [Micrococcus sp. EYE_162]